LADGEHNIKGFADARNEQLNALFREHASFVWRVVKRLGVPEADAEDAVQEVFLVVAKRFDTYEERGAFRAWLVAIARQVAQHALRARFRRERKVRELTVPAPGGDPHCAFEQTQAVALVNAVMSSLEPDQALVFYLAEVEEMSVPEIAASLQQNVNTIYSRLRLARQRFEAQVRRSMCFA
jgi:RNA polymerase sigma-70 factor, ECF subfamily